jgi:hypothetical protein
MFAMPSMRHRFDVLQLRERRLSFVLFSVMLAKKNVLLFYRMCYHYSLRPEEAIRKGIKMEIRFSKRKIR